MQVKQVRKNGKKKDNKAPIQRQKNNANNCNDNTTSTIITRQKWPDMGVNNSIIISSWTKVSIYICQWDDYFETCSQLTTTKVASVEILLTVTYSLYT